MKSIFIHETEIKEITKNLVENKIIFHPRLSKDGDLNFENYCGKKLITILDRNIMTKLIELCTTGSLKDKYIQKIISSLMVWTELYRVDITSGFALLEYADFNKCDKKASKENLLFLRIFNYYEFDDWLNLAMGKSEEIPIIEIGEFTQKFKYYECVSHQRIHYAEMLYIFRLYMDKDMQDEDKVINFIEWIDENLVFCVYSVVYVALLFSRKIKQFKKNCFDDLESMKKKCENQAWDLTHLSNWSTIYWYEDESDKNYLFATMDKDLKTIFLNGHDVTSNLFVRTFGEKKGNYIQHHYESIVDKREKNEIVDEDVEQLICTEYELLVDQFNKAKEM